VESEHCSKSCSTSDIDGKIGLLRNSKYVVLSTPTMSHKSGYSSFTFAMTGALEFVWFSILTSVCLQTVTVDGADVDMLFLSCIE